MTLEDTLLFDLTVWKNVSTHCKDLLSKMLTKDPVTRITLAGAYNHKFFDSVRQDFVKSPSWT